MSAIKNIQKILFGRSMVRNFGIYTIAKVLNSCIPFFLLPVMTAYLTPSDYGIISMITTLAAFCLPFVGLNTESAIVRKFYDKNIEISRYIGSCLLLLFLCLTIVNLLFIFFATPLSRITEIPNYIIYLIPIYCFFLYFKTIVQYYWQANEQPLKYGSFTVLFTFLEIAIALFLIIIVGLNWHGRAISLLSANFITAMFAIFYLKKHGMISIQYDKDYSIHAIKYGIGLLPHAIGGGLIALANRFFITNFINIEETGLYGVATQLANLLSFITLSFNNAFVPWLYKNLSFEKCNKKRIVRLIYLYMCALSILSVIIYLVLIFIFPFFINDSFADAMKYIPFLLLGYLFQGFYFVQTNFIMYSEKTYYNGLVTIISGLISLLLNWLFIREYGAVGAAIAFSITYIIYFLITWAVSQRVHKMPWLSFM